jgi:hypothetical protein
MERAYERGHSGHIGREHELANEIAGVMAEVATRQLFDLPIAPVFDHATDQGKSDLILPRSGRSAEVKSMRHDPGNRHLIVPPYSEPGDADVWLFVPQCTYDTVRFAGYWHGASAWEWKDFHRGEGFQHCKHEGRLLSVLELLWEEL